MENGIIRSESQVGQLIDLLKKAHRLLILTHGNPDPDALAASFALKYLVRRSVRCQARVAYPGIISRRENQAMVRELSLKPVPLKEIIWRDYDTIALIDHQPRRRFYYWPENRWPDIIIDHHPRRPLKKPVQFVDIRTDFGSSSSLLASYLIARGLIIPGWLSTALAYGIKTDTQDFSRGRIDMDKAVYKKLFDAVNHTKLYRITHPVQNCHYLSHYWRGIKAARIWNDIAESYIGEIPAPDYTAEIADHLLIISGIRYALVTGFYGNTLHMSLRIANPRRDAGVLLRKIVGRRGSAGGHGFMAGAQILDVSSADEAKRLAGELHSAFVCHLHPDCQSEDCRPVLMDD